MKNKRNSLSSLILACAFFANVSYAAELYDTSDFPTFTTTGSSIIGSVTVENTHGDSVGFDSNNLSYYEEQGTGAGNDSVTDEDSLSPLYTDYYDIPLVSAETEKREIEYEIEYTSSNTYYTNVATGEVYDFYGFIEDLTYDEDTNTWTNSSGDTVSMTLIGTNYINQYDTYLVVELTDIDMDITAITGDGDATALDLTGMVTSYNSYLNDVGVIITTIETTNGITDSSYVKNDDIDLAFTDVFTGGIDITAYAEATGGDAIAVSGYINHSISTIDLSDTSVTTQWDNGNLVLDLTAKATATYDTEGTYITGGTAIGIQYVAVEAEYSPADVANADVVSETSSDAVSVDSTTGTITTTTTTETTYSNGVVKTVVSDGTTTTTTYAASTTETTITDSDGTLSVTTVTDKTDPRETETVTSSNNGITTVLYSDNGDADVKINAVSVAAGAGVTTYTSANIDAAITAGTYVGAYGVIGDVYIESGSVSISAYAYDFDLEDKKEGDDLIHSSSGYGIAILGDAEFIGTKVTLTAYSDDGYATTVYGDLELTAGASLTALVYAYEAVGIENGYFTDASLNATVVALDEDGVGKSSVVGATNLYAKNSDISIAAYSSQVAATTATVNVIGAKTLEIYGASSLNITAVSIYAAATGVETLNLGYSATDTLKVSVYAQGTNAIGAETINDVDGTGDTDYRGAVHSQNAYVAITAVATGSSTTTSLTTANTATDGTYNAYALGVNDNIALSTDANYIVDSFNGNIYAQASYTATGADSSVLAIAVDGGIGASVSDTTTTVQAADGYTIDLKGSYAASATATSDTVATATATAINGIVYANISATVQAVATVNSSATASTATATAIDGDVNGDISGNISAYAIATGAGDATATAIYGDVDGNISGTVYAYAEAEKGTAEAIAIDGNVGGDITGTVIAEAIGSDATGISGSFTGTFSGTLSVSATSVEDGDDATAIGIADLDSGATISGTVSASATAEGLGSSAEAAAIVVNADSTVYFEDATLEASASVADDTATVTSTAIDAGTYNLTTVGDATVSGDITAGTLTLGETVNEIYYGSTITQVDGSLNANITVSNSASNYSMGFNVEGDLPVGTGTVTYSYATDAANTTTALSTMLTANAATLVGDSYTFESGTIVFDATDITSLEDTSVDGANGLSYDLDVSPSNSSATVTVTETTYFQDKTSSANANSIAKKLDAISLSDAAEVYYVSGEGHTYNGTDFYTSEDEAEDAAEDAADAKNLTTRTFKTTVDNMNLDSFVPYSNSQIAQANAETFANLSLANVWRMRSLMSESSKTAREKAVEAIMANPEFDGIDPDPTAKPKRVAQFQSVNIIGSRDGGANAPDYDLISTGGTADLDFFFGKDLVAGVGLGSVYNRVDAGSTAGVAESTSFIINSYAMWTKDELEVFGSLGYAHTFNESKKSTTEGTSKSKWDSDSIYNLAGVSYSVDFENGLILRPMAMYSLVFQNYGESKSVNSNAYNANVDATSYVNFRTLIGAELVYSVSEQFEIIARLFWSHEFIDNSYDLDYTNDLLSQYIGSLSLQGEEADRDMFIAGLGLAYRFENGISAYLDYNANASGDYLGHNLNAAIQMKF